MTRSRFLSYLGISAALAAAATFVTVEATADEAADPGRIVERFRSQLLGEERAVAVHLPEGYAVESGRRYGTLYVLDGASQAGHTAESAALLARANVIEPLIVIGVASLDGDRRSRDYTPPDQRTDADDPASSRGGADRFLAHLERELVPRIESTYRTARPRLLAGWSRGGLFAVWSAIAAPDLFDGRLALSPAVWREDGRVIAQLERNLAGAASPPAPLYLALGEGENAKMAAAFERLRTVLERAAPSGSRWRANLTHGATHSSNPRLATPVGLHFLLAPARDCDGNQSASATLAGAARRPGGAQPPRTADRKSP
jgi:predicted alpha/beta superfamily hydrolase